MHYVVVVLLSWVCGFPLFLDKVVPIPATKPAKTSASSEKPADPSKEEKKPEVAAQSKPASAPSPTQPPTSEPQASVPLKEPSASRPTVYVTKLGREYHSAGCFYLRDNSFPIDLKDAESKYAPCSYCRPTSAVVQKACEPTATSETPASVVAPSPQREKTIRVKGYYRKDGTYVQPHNRRPPRKK